MCSIEQCSRCSHDFDSCGHYVHTAQTPCRHFLKPIDNSKMFARWYKFSGRIGRLEYVLTLLISVVLFVLFQIGNMLILLLLFDGEIDASVVYVSYVSIRYAMIPSVYLLIASGIKRTHDTGVSVWYALIPVGAVLCLFGMPHIIPDVITILIGIAGIAGCVYLLKDAGEDGINEHGSNPARSYVEQIRLSKHKLNWEK